MTKCDYCQQETAPKDLYMIPVYLQSAFRTWVCRSCRPVYFSIRKPKK